MQLEHSFTVPVDVARAWEVLLDIERVAPCMPGAVVDSIDGDDFTGRVKIKLGPVNLTYKGSASFVEKDAEAHRVVIDARGKDSRGNGTAAAKVTATLVAQGEATEVKVLTDLNITGRPAQFGRGVMVDVGNKLIGQFATCLEGKLSGGSDEAAAAAADGSGAGSGSGGDSGANGGSDPGGGSGSDVESTRPASAPVPGAPTPGPAPQPAARPAPAAVEPEPIDLLGLAGGGVLTKVTPAVAGGVLLAVLFFLLGRRSAR